MLNQIQNIRLNYISVPIDYVRELKRLGERHRARAFMEYFDDLDSGTVNSVRFYAEAWKISKSTADRWIGEFKEEIGLYHAHWSLKNDRHYKSVQKSGGTVAGQNTPCEVRQEGQFEKNVGQSRDKVFNNISSSNSVVNFYDAEFEDMYFGCRLSNKQVGKKDEIYEEYQKHKNINYKDMRFAYLFYLSDKKAYKEGRAFGLVNFMRNQVYLNYLKLKVRVELENKIIEGEYDREHSKLVCEDGTYYSFSPERFLELLRQDKIIISEKAA